MSKDKYAEFRYIWSVQQHSDATVAVRIVQDMRIMLHRPNILSKSLGALWNLSAADKNREFLTSIGAGQAVIDVMNAFKKDNKLLKLACGVLKNLGGNLLALEKMGAGECVMRSLRQFKDDKDLVEQACSAIRNLGQSKQNAESMVKRGVARLIMDAMKAHHNRPDTLKQACSALWSLSTAPDCKEHLWGDGVGNAVIVAMQNFTNEERLQENGLGLIWTIGYHYSVMRIGAGEVVLEALKRHASAPAIVLYCCYIVRNLGSIRSNAIQLVDMDVAEALMTAMIRHSSNSNIQDNGCSAFWALSLWTETKPKLLNKGVSPFSLDILKKAKDNVKVFNSAISVLTNLAAKPENAGQMDRPDIGRAVLAGMARFSTHETAIEKSIFCLRNVFFWDGQGLRDLKAEGPIQKALMTYNRNSTIEKKAREILDKMRDQ